MHVNCYNVCVNINSWASTRSSYFGGEKKRVDRSSDSISLCSVNYRDRHGGVDNRNNGREERVLKQNFVQMVANNRKDAFESDIEISTAADDDDGQSVVSAMSDGFGMILDSTERRSSWNSENSQSSHEVYDVALGGHKDSPIAKRAGGIRNRERADDLVSLCSIKKSRKSDDEKGAVHAQTTEDEDQEFDGLMVVVNAVNLGLSLLCQ